VAGDTQGAGTGARGSAGADASGSGPARRLDVLVVGSGVAGLSAAVRLATGSGSRVGVLTKGALEQSTTRWAQGGIAAVLPGDEDSTDRHLADTLRVGAGLCDEAAVRVLVDEGPARVIELIALGASFDRLPSGDLARAIEGGHSSARVLHAGGTATGAEVERALVEAVSCSAAAVLEHWFALDLLIREGRCRGVVALSPSGEVITVEAEHVVLASGGAGQLYSVTTNPDEATGDGLAMALRAGALVADVEFVQFHPTALHHPVMPRPLLSEALRGHGALLRDAEGQRFVDELQPRDVVSRAIAAKLSVHGVDHVWLDCTPLADFSRRFPTIARALAAAGYDAGRDWLPVAPAAHYICGGVVTDLDGASSLPGLWAAGEAACTGVHGANRLASNSLLEGMVFGARVVDAIVSGKDGPSASGAFSVEGSALSVETVTVPDRAPLPLPDAGHAKRRTAGPGTAGLGTAGLGNAGLGTAGLGTAALRSVLQSAMTADAGIVRDAVSLVRARETVDEVSRSMALRGRPSSVAEAELANLCEVARATLASALARQESRGAHARSDFEDPSDRFRLRLGIGGHDREAARAVTGARS
jgi:L-aspartate oxidase